VNHLLRLLGISLLGLVLAACNLEPTTPTATAEPEIEPQANYYKQFGGQVNNTSVSTNYPPSMALDSSGNPVVSWSEHSGFSSKLYVKRWTGSSWIQVGTFLNANTDKGAFSPSLALDNSDNPVVSWQETDGTSFNIYVKRWNGSSWVQLGATFLDVNTNQSAQYSSLAVDSSGNPVVSWEEYDGTSINTYVKRWNGSSWVQLGTFEVLGTNQSARFPSLALDSSDNPVVSWNEIVSGSGNILVKRWNGSSWVEVGGFLDVVVSSIAAFKPSIAIDTSDNLVVSWIEGNGTSTNIYVKRWNGSGWVQLGTFLDANTNKNVDNPTITVDSSGNPVVSWEESDGTSANIYVKRWTGSSWQQTDGVFDNVKANNAVYPSLALDSANNPVVAWSESNNIYVKVFYKNVFKPFGDSVHFSIGDDATNPSIALNAAGNPMVAWEEFEGTTFYDDLFVRRWDGTSWPSVGTTDIKVSTAISNDAVSPSLAAEKTTSNPVIAWAEGPGGLDSYNIQVQRWNGTAWVNYGSTTPLDRTASNTTRDPSLALDSNNYPYVAWTEQVGSSSNVYVKRWTGTAWAWVGGSAGLRVDPASNAFSASLAIGTDNKPVIAWAEENASVNSSIYVKKLVGNTWTLVGTTAIDTSIANYALDPSLDLDSSNNPIVAWTEFVDSVFGFSSNLYAKRWNGSAWIPLGNALLRYVIDKSSSRDVYNPVLVVGSNNNPVLTWSEDTTSTSDISANIYVKRWTGTVWQQVSTGAVDTVLSQHAFLPSVVLNAANNPVVAWSESTGIPNGNNIYVKGF
jgi:hypothetical protein